MDPAASTATRASTDADADAEHSPDSPPSPASNPSSPGDARKKRPSDGPAKTEREKRTYRACLHCRQRKSRCDL